MSLGHNLPHKTFSWREGIILYISTLIYFIQFLNHGVGRQQGRDFYLRASSLFFYMQVDETPYLLLDLKGIRCIPCNNGYDVIKLDDF